MDVEICFSFFMLNIMQILQSWQDLSKTDNDILPPFPLEVVAVIYEINRMLYADIMAAAVPLGLSYSKKCFLMDVSHTKTYGLFCVITPLTFFNLTGETIESLTELTQLMILSRG